MICNNCSERQVIGVAEFGEEQKVESLASVPHQLPMHGSSIQRKGIDHQNHMQFVSRKNRRMFQTHCHSYECGCYYPPGIPRPSFRKILPSSMKEKEDASCWSKVRMPHIVVETGCSDRRFTTVLISDTAGPPVFCSIRSVHYYDAEIEV